MTVYIHSGRQEMLRCVTAVAAATTFEKSWKCISVVDASLAFGLYGDKNIFVPLGGERVRMGGAGCVCVCV